jgi:rifampicin phosphotransferase
VVDISRPWVVDSPLSRRFPVYTRANVGEVSPHVATPLFFSLIGGPPSEAEWIEALVEFGAFDAEELLPDVPWDRDGADPRIVIQGMIHGYIYLNLSNLRVFGARMPGASPELMDRTYLGDTKAPAYVAHPDDAKPEYTERILATVGRVFADKHRDDVMIEDRDLAYGLRRERPDLDQLSDAELVARTRYILAPERYGRVLRKHLRLVYEGSILSGALDEAVAKLGDPSLTMTLTAGLGNIASAAPSNAIWDLARQVKASPALTAEFDKGVAELGDRLRASNDADVTAFVEKFDEFLYEFGSRSTNEWDPGAETWETHQYLPLGMIDRMRLQNDAKNPRQQSRRLAEEREAKVAELKTQLDPEAWAGLEALVNSNMVYLAAREQSKTNTIRVLQEARLPLIVLGRRLAERGIFNRPDDIQMILSEELEDMVEDPQRFKPLIAERLEWRDALSDLEPPFIIDGEIPPIATWAKRKDPAVERAGSGDVLSGIGACPGVATGKARVITDPSAAADLEPGEILVAPMTDPGWTPLFTSAEAVVVNVGASMSHAAIVSRELGIPCVLNVKFATKRIADGTTITVDGAAGTVTIG